MESCISLPLASAVEYNIRCFFYNFKGILCPVLLWVVFLSNHLFLPGENFQCVLMRGLCIAEGGVLVYVLISARMHNMLKY